MRDVEDDLRRYGAAVERAVPAVGAPSGPRPRARRWRWTAVAVAAAAVAALLFVALDDTDDHQVTTEPSATSAPTTPSTTSESTSGTAPATSSLRTFPVVATIECPPGTRCFRGEQYLVWAGEAGSETAIRADGFAVDLSTGAVRPIAAAPIDPRSAATGVWTGSELIVCCGTGQLDGHAADTASAAAWNADTGEWRVLADPPVAIARSYAASVWTGEQMVVVAPGGSGAAYDPDADEWQPIPAPPVHGGHPEAAWTGGSIIVWDPGFGSGVQPDEEVADRGYTWSPGEAAWMPLPTLPPGSRTRMGSMAWTGTDLVVWGQSTADDSLGVGARWRPGDDGWRAMSAHPAGPVEDPFDGTPGSQTLAATDDGRVLVKDLDGGGLSSRADLYDPASDTWHGVDLLLPGYHPSVTVVGDEVLVPDEDQPIAGRLPG
jgi:hypothetical protein